MVRKTSVNWKLSTITPASLEKAPALTMFMPQAARAPATSAKRRRAVAGDDGEVEELAMGAQVELNRVLVEIGGHLEVIADLLGEAGLQVALRKALKELLERVVLRGRDHGADAVEQRGIDGGVVADLVDGAVHEVGGGHVELPEILGLPRGERVGVDGLDVGDRSSA